MPRKAAVHIYQRGSAWQVYYAGSTPRYRKDWATEAEALRDKELLMRRIAGVGIAKEQMRSVESSLHRLATTELPGRGKSVEFAVEWFLRHYQGEDTSKPIHEYAEVYLGLKKDSVEAKTLLGLNTYIPPFIAEFGHLKPQQISASTLLAYLKSNTSRHYRDKALRPFFHWLTGQAPKKANGLACLENPPLEVDPMGFVPREKYKKKHPTEVLTLVEILRVLEEARKEEPGVLSWIIWLMFTGMRPESEALPFWAVADPEQPSQPPEHGWSKIDLERWQIMVTDDLEKTGTVVRDITIQPCLREWIPYLQKHRPYYSRRALRRVFDNAIPKKRTQDILRHTYISNALKIMKESDVCYEAATSSKMIKKHYRRQIPQSEADRFWAITPAVLGLPP